jgi:hypothetical protein
VSRGVGREVGWGVGVGAPGGGCAPAGVFGEREEERGKGGGRGEEAAGSGTGGAPWAAAGQVAAGSSGLRRSGGSAYNRGVGEGVGGIEGP